MTAVFPCSGVGWAIADDLQIESVVDAIDMARLCRELMGIITR